MRLDIFVNALDVIFQVLKTFERFLTSFTDEGFRFKSVVEVEIVARKSIVSQQTLLEAKS